MAHRAFRQQSGFFGAGEFRDRVTIQAPMYNSPADEITGWTDFLATWANIDPEQALPARAGTHIVVEAGREISLSAVLVRIRYQAPIPDTTMRVVTEGATYTDSTRRFLATGTAYLIHNVYDVGSRQRELHLVCRVVL